MYFISIFNINNSNVKGYNKLVHFGVVCSSWIDLEIDIEHYLY